MKSQISLSVWRNSTLTIHRRQQQRAKMMERGTLVVNWGIIQTLLRAYYPVGQSPEGASAYYPMMLLKILLLQECFHIPSDGELENLINDRIPHKKCLGFSFDMLALDHALFFRFRSSYVTIH